MTHLALLHLQVALENGISVPLVWLLLDIVFRCISQFTPLAARMHWYRRPAGYAPSWCGDIDIRSAFLDLRYMMLAYARQSSVSWDEDKPEQSKRGGRLTSISYTSLRKRILPGSF